MNSDMKIIAYGHGLSQGDLEMDMAKDESFDEPWRPEYHVEPKTLIMFEYVWI